MRGNEKRLKNALVAAIFLGVAMQVSASTLAVIPDKLMHRETRFTNQSCTRAESIKAEAPQSSNLMIIRDSSGSTIKGCWWIDEDLVFASVGRGLFSYPRESVKFVTDFPLRTTKQEKSAEIDRSKARADGISRRGGELEEQPALTRQTASWSEFMGGRRATYTTTGDRKAKGIKVAFDYPISWAGAEGKRANTLYQIASEGGRGLELCNLVVKEIPLPAGYEITKEDVAGMFEPAELKKSFVPEGAQIISASRTTIDGQPAGQVQFTHDMDRAGIRFRMLWITYPIYYDKRLVAFSCGVGDHQKKSATDLNQRYKLFAPLFQQMANSIVIHNQWK